MIAINNAIESKQQPTPFDGLKEFAVVPPELHEFMTALLGVLSTSKRIEAAMIELCKTQTIMLKRMKSAERVRRNRPIRHRK